MAHAGDSATGMWISLDPHLEALLSRMEALSLEPRFLVQRQGALARALQPYTEAGAAVALPPLPEELALARLYLYADFYPEDGQFSLVEQVRDLVEVHVPEEERQWLDPLKHSSMDLLEIVGVAKSGEQIGLQLRSLGDGREYRPVACEFGRAVHVGQVLLTRLIAHADRCVLPGTGVVLRGPLGRSVLDATNEARREMEVLAGSFELGEWGEFTKRYPHALMWNLAQARLEALIRTDSTIRYRTSVGDRYLYAVALYEHHELKFLKSQFEAMGDWQAAKTDSRHQAGGEAMYTWLQPANEADGPDGGPVARLTLTPTQLVVECDSRERLDNVKHMLAATFGFSVHFSGESTTPPRHALLETDLAEETSGPRTVVAAAEEDQRLLAALLESVYLDWSDRPSPALGGKTPRHAAADADLRAKVAALIDELERADLGLRRTGKPAYDYNQLRAHVGL